MGNDLSVARAARVSYDAAWRAGEDKDSDTRLIRRLWRDRHTSPFEAVVFTFEVRAPIFVFRQWHRHRTWSYSETSARYREMPEEYYLPELDKIGEQSKDNKQMRLIGTDVSVDAANARALMDVHCQQAFALYRSMLTDGIPREVARLVLPLATYSHMFAVVSLLNLLKFLTLRTAADAQYEIRVYGDAMLELASMVAPVCVQAWKDFK